MSFDGATYDEKRDEERLGSLLESVRTLMLDGKWRSLAEIVFAVKAGTEASVSARLRDLRKDQFGGHVVERQHVGDGLWRYRVRVSAPPAVEVAMPEKPDALFDMPRPSLYDVD